MVGAGAWLALTPVLHHAFYPQVSTGLVAAAAVTVVTQLLETTAPNADAGKDGRDGKKRR